MNNQSQRYLDAKKRQQEMEARLNPPVNNVDELKKRIQDILLDNRDFRGYKNWNEISIREMIDTHTRIVLMMSQLEKAIGGIQTDQYNYNTYNSETVISIADEHIVGKLLESDED